VGRPAARSRTSARHLAPDAAVKWVFDFSEGSRAMRAQLGGKGAGVAEMTRLLGQHRVPPGFTISTTACVAYMRTGTEPEGLSEQVEAALGRLERAAGKRYGDARDPLLLSVRSGARESMPGMLDTILNVGLNDQSVTGLAVAAGNKRFADDCYRRLIEMFGSVVGGELPQDPREQLWCAIRAVFDSWRSERAVAYRRLNRIPDEWGTAVNVQQMVFGNKGERSASGVAFSRDEVTGDPRPSGDFLIGAQGEDIVAGIRTPRDLAELAELMPDVHAELLETLRVLETHYKDMQDTEFTVEEGHLYMLQTRTAKRPAQAAVRFAVDAVDEGLLTRQEALRTIDAASLEALLHPTFDRGQGYRVLARGVAASPGAAAGEIAFTPQAAIAASHAGRRVILVRPFTEADDVVAFGAVEGLLTAEGGKASHAALVARGMGLPAVTGAEIIVDVARGELALNGRVLRESDLIAIDGSEGAVVEHGAKLVEPAPEERFQRLLGWADQIRTLSVRANADTPADAVRARALGAEGIGLCRTEHMFMAEGRQAKMQAVIMAADPRSRRAALRELLPLQEEDFMGIFDAMRGLPVTLRLLDPPLHEFLPDLADLRAAVERARLEGDVKLPERERLLMRVEELVEVNPMLGTRGCRLGILYPEVYEMQVEAIARAAKRAAHMPQLELMIPLVAYERELEQLRALIGRVAAQHGLVGYTVGTMIELPRACLIADRISRHAEFFSFGTNDLTQTALGFSRDDVEASFMPVYIKRGILDRSPFETIDASGVGWLVRRGTRLGREARPGLKLGVCGEHAGDPASIAFFHRAGLDYVSCSPPRIPIARIAAAQAAID
jgi:pyruvate,orthophosphate dikinase